MEIILKLASSLDGKIALSNGQSQWITNEKARQNVHELRAGCDAIISGIGTVLKDNPSFTARLTNQTFVPKRLILDSNLQTPIDYKITNKDTVFFTGENIDEAKEAEFKKLDIEIIKAKEVTPRLVINYAKSKSYNKLLIEAGSKIAASFLNDGFVNKIYWYRAPIIIGGDGLDVIDNLGIDAISAAKRIKLLSSENFDDDILEIYEIGN